MAQKADNSPDLVWTDKHERMCRRRNISPDFIRFTYAVMKPVDPEITVEEIIRDMSRLAKKQGYL
jgi:hypothetical protein